MRHRSKLTPPIESTYSVVGEDIPTPNPIMEDHYSHLRDQTEIKMGEGDGEGIVEKESYSLIGTPDPIKKVTTVTESEYSVVTDNKISKYRKNPPPALPARPKTTYARYNSGKDGKDRVNIPSPGLVLSEVEETVSKIKFNLIMEQLRKIQVHGHSIIIRETQLMCVSLSPLSVSLVIYNQCVCVCLLSVCLSLSPYLGVIVNVCVPPLSVSLFLLSGCMYI